MKTIDFIEKDIAKLKTSRRWLPALLSFVLLALSMALGLLLRKDQIGVWSLATLAPNLALALCLVFAAYSLFKAERAGTRLLAAATIAGLALSLSRMLFSTPTTYASSAIFWHEAGKCTFAGLGAGAAAAGALTLLLFRFAPLPTARRRIAIALTAALTGVGMLAFHCDSASAAHVFLSHWGPGLIVFAVALAIQSLLFRRAIKKIF